MDGSDVGLFGNFQIGALNLNHTCLKVSLYTCYKFLWLFLLAFIHDVLCVYIFVFPSCSTPASTRQPNIKPILS